MLTTPHSTGFWHFYFEDCFPPAAVATPAPSSTGHLEHRLWMAHCARAEGTDQWPLPSDSSDGVWLKSQMWSGTVSDKHSIKSAAFGWDMGNLLGLWKKGFLEERASGRSWMWLSQPLPTLLPVVLFHHLTLSMSVRNPGSSSFFPNCSYVLT